MRYFLFFCMAAAAAAILIPSCVNSHKISNKINATVEPDTTRTVMPATEPVKKYDSIQIEFGDILSVPYDSIYNLKLYGFIKENLGKKCFPAIPNNYNCESFLAALFKNVYALDIPAGPAQQMKYKNFELFKDTSYLKAGDVLFFKASGSQQKGITHAGFYLHNGYFLIATYKSGVVITRLNNNYWSKHFAAAGRITRLNDITKTN